MKVPLPIPPPLKFGVILPGLSNGGHRAVTQIRCSPIINVVQIDDPKSKESEQHKEAEIKNTASISIDKSPDIKSLGKRKVDIIMLVFNVHNTYTCIVSNIIVCYSIVMYSVV